MSLITRALRRKMYFLGDRPRTDKYFINVVLFDEHPSFSNIKYLRWFPDDILIYGFKKNAKK